MDKSVYKKKKDKMIWEGSWYLSNILESSFYTLQTCLSYTDCI